MITCSLVQIRQMETTEKGEQRRTGRTLLACNCGWTTGWVKDGEAWRGRVRHESTTASAPAGGS
ncbi:hypothetical protein ACIRPQ_29200 [Streptomyces sp. NPDC101213]|uniref:hypothetical protein n=1 Tax=Streptomyces sp. NPDC101213 TaxID=3366130 RepID=UPI00380F8E32